MIERSNLLDRDFLAGWLVQRRAAKKSAVPFTETEISDLPDYTVSTLTDYVLNVILIGDVERNLSRATRWSGLLLRLSHLACWSSPRGAAEIE